MGWAGAGAAALMGQAKGNQQRERGDRRGARPGALFPVQLQWESLPYPTGWPDPPPS